MSDPTRACVVDATQFRCRNCKQDKPSIEFSAYELSAEKFRCRKCRSISSAERQARQGGKLAEAQRLRRILNLTAVRENTNRWRSANRDKVKLCSFVANISRYYGLTPEGYAELRALSNGCCSICDMHPHSGLRVVIDHSHRTGKPRGILCDYCNLALRAFDDKELMRRALRYLQERDS